MTDQLPPIETDPNEETAPTDLERTRANQPISPDDVTQPMSATRAIEKVQDPQPRRPRQPTAYTPRQRRPPPRKQDSALYFPLWSLALMLIIVLGVAFAIVFAVANLGNQSVSEADPIIRIITAIPSNTPIPANNTSFATPTFPPNIEVVPQQTPSDLTLSGPALPTISFTNTPTPITIGSVIAVDGVGADELNIRDVAGITTSTILFRAPEGEQFTVVEGPAQADGFTWWRIQDPANPNRSGWAVANYLIIPNQP